MARIVLLAQPVLDKMLTNSDFREFSCITNPPRTRAGARAVKVRSCGGCPGRRQAPAATKVAENIDYNMLKRMIVSLPEQQIATLKERLNCTGLKVQWRDGHGAVKRVVI